MPQRNSSANSRPLAECSVMSCTLSWYASAWPSPDSSTANARNSASGGRSLSLGAHDLARGVDELLEVLDARLAADVRALAVMRDQAAALDDARDLLVQRIAARVGVERLDEVQEAEQRLGGALRQRSFGDQRGRGAPQARARAARVLADGLDGARADAARRRVDDALERRVVVAVHDEPQVRERVLDLGALEEAQAPVDAVRNAGREQAFLEHARLRVRAIEHGGLAALAALGDVVLDAVDDELGLVALVERRVELDRLARRALGPQRLAEPRGVVRDDGVRGVQDRRRRAVVLLEPHDLRARRSPAGSDTGSRRARRASGRSTGRRRRRRTACRRARPADAASGTGSRSCPGTRRRARAGSGAGTGAAARGCRATARGCAAAARRSRRRTPRRTPARSARRGRSSAGGPRCPRRAAPSAAGPRPSAR